MQMQVRWDCISEKEVKIERMVASGEEVDGDVATSCSQPILLGCEVRNRKGTLNLLSYLIIVTGTMGGARVKIFCQV